MTALRIQHTQTARRAVEVCQLIFGVAPQGALRPNLVDSELRIVRNGTGGAGCTHFPIGSLVAMAISRLTARLRNLFGVTQRSKFSVANV